MIDIHTNGTETKRQQTEISRAAEFVSKIIDSCKDTFQLQCSQRLLQFFKEMYYERHRGKIEYERLQSQIVDKIPLITTLI